MKKMIRIAELTAAILIFSITFGYAAVDTLWTAEDLTGAGTPLWHRISESPMPAVSYHSPSMSFWCGNDSFPLYQANQEQALVLNYRFDLSQYQFPRMTFWHYLDMDKDSDDRACVDISTDGGLTWNLAVGEFLPSKVWLQNVVDLSTFQGQVITLRFRFTSDSYNIYDGYGWFIDDIELHNISGLQTVYSNDFDTDRYTEFTHYGIVGNDDWVRENAMAYNGAYSYHAKPNVKSWTALQTPEFDFTGLIAPQLTFYHFYEMPFGPAESNWSNGAIVEISTDPAASAAAWEKLYPVGGYPAYCTRPMFGNPLGDVLQTGDADVEGFYGYQRSWQPVQFDLTAYVGQPQVWIRFSSGCDQWGPWNDRQWYVDDVRITDFAGAEPFFASDMEFVDQTPAEAVVESFADFVAAVDALPAEAFREYKSVDKAVKEMEKLFKKFPEKKEGRLLEIYQWLLRPLHQRVLLERLDRIEAKYVTEGKFRKAARKIEKQVLAHMDGGKNDWVLGDYQLPLYEQGTALVAALRAADAAGREDEEDDEPLAKAVAGNGMPQQALSAAVMGVAPNPVTEHTVISYTLDAAAAVTLDVFDLTGRHIISLADGMGQAGTSRVAWDARNGDGARVAAGNYLAVLNHDGIRTVTMVHVLR